MSDGGGDGLEWRGWGKLEDEGGKGVEQKRDDYVVCVFFSCVCLLCVGVRSEDVTHQPLLKSWSDHILLH